MSKKLQDCKNDNRKDQLVKPIPNERKVFIKHQIIFNKNDKANVHPQVKDNKRQISSKDKDFVWNNALSHPLFDKNIFRHDICGNPVIRKNLYRRDNAAKVFSVEYEHFVAHNNGGRSDISNVCLLNAGINRSKGKTGF